MIYSSKACPKAQHITFEVLTQRSLSLIEINGTSVRLTTDLNGTRVFYFLGDEAIVQGLPTAIPVTLNVMLY